MDDCPLCASRDGPAIWRDDRLRVISAAEADYPGFVRVVWNAHVREMSDLAAGDRAHCMRIVFAVEEALCAGMKPSKVNLASLGNQVPHVHWHVIPRHPGDAHFPDPVWAARRRPGAPLHFDVARFLDDFIRALG